MIIPAHRANDMEVNETYDNIEKCCQTAAAEYYKIENGGGTNKKQILGNAK